MGRSVDYHRDQYRILYFHYTSPTWENEYGNEERVYDDFILREDWDNYKDYIIETIQSICPSIENASNEWQGNEVLKIAENNLCSIWISEYCGLVSLSFVPSEEKESLATHWIEQVFDKIKDKFIKNKTQVLNKLGSFSNGEEVFELSK